MGARAWRVRSATRRTRTAVAKRLGDAGARTGLAWLEYNPLVFAYYHEKAAADAPVVIESLERAFPAAASYYDVGAGTGAYAAEARRRGHRVLASERSRLARLAARAQRVPTTRLDLRREPAADTAGASFDLAYCFEVAEHVPPALADRLVAHLAAAAPAVVFTAAAPGQGGTGHINEQPKGYWRERFAARGLQPRDDLAAALAERWRAAPVRSHWLPGNVMVFERGSAPA